jgi:chemotaxis family two-component system response regulator Rcp1
MKRDTAPKTVRILLIEDNAADVDLMKYALDKGHFRYELITLKDGTEALAFIRGEGKYAHAAQPGLIVMDLHFPKSDGMEVLEEIRGNPKFAELLVAVLSSSVSPEEKNRIAALKRTCFIAKPLDLDGFIKVGKTIKRLSLEGKASASGAAS